MLGVAVVFGGSLFSAMHGSLVTSSLIRETTENESANEGYRFGQEEHLLPFLNKFSLRVRW
jgi:photosystem II P680 reaction center D1 protein